VTDRLELYTAFQFIRTKDGTYGTSPQVEVNYGAAPNLQLHAIAPTAFDHPAGGAMTRGLGDVEFGAKYRFARETSDRPQAGVFVLVSAPTGDEAKGLGNGRTQVFLPVWIQKSIGPWTTYGGGGYWFNPGPGNKDWVYAGWLLQRRLSSGVTLGVELFHRTPDVIGGGFSAGFTGGGQIDYNKSYHLLFSAGSDLRGPNRFTGYGGVKWTH
jgi:hypothetical protein